MSTVRELSRHSNTGKAKKEEKYNTDQITDRRKPETRRDGESVESIKGDIEKSMARISEEKWRNEAEQSDEVKYGIFEGKFENGRLDGDTGTEDFKGLEKPAALGATTVFL